MIAVTGASGLLGSEMMRYLDENNISAIGLTRTELDFTDRERTQALFGKIKPELIIHCGAYSKVDMAEEERQECFDVNVNGVENVVDACLEFGSELVYISTDYVFDGLKQGYYIEDDLKNPLSVYGKSKAEAEDKIIAKLDKYYIIRTSWLFGKGGRNFVDTIISLSKKNDEINVVFDQIGSPTYTVDLTKAIFEILKKHNFGIYNVTNSGECSWADFAEKIIDLAGNKCSVKRINTKGLGAKALRPINSKLSKEKFKSLGIEALPHWNDALERYIIEKSR